MSTDKTWQTVSKDSEHTEQLGEQLGSCLRGGEVIELIADVGGGKTTFVKGLARGLGSEAAVSSPTFTLSQVYPARDGLQLCHFDFYRLSQPGIMTDELSEIINDTQNITVIEWAEIVHGVLPAEHISINFEHQAENQDSRLVSLSYPKTLPYLDQLEDVWQDQK